MKPDAQPVPLDTTSRFSHEEYEGRLLITRRAMLERGIDLLLVDDTEDLAYLTGYGPRGTLYQACVITSQGSPVAIVRAADEATFLDASWSSHHLAYADDEDAVVAVASVISTLGGARARIGVDLESHFLPVRRFKQLRQQLPAATFVDSSRMLREQRLIKSAAEIDCHRRACRITDAAMAHAVEAVGEGISERAAAIAVYRTVLGSGGDNSYSAIITSGARVEAMHGHLTGRILASGDTLHIELLPQVNGYSGRLMRTTIIGKPTDRQRTVADRLLAIQDEQLAALRPGAVANTVDRLCRDQVIAESIVATYRNVTGYTLGYNPMVATPRTSDFTRCFVPSANWEIKANMVFHMYVWAAGMAFSETVLITETGHERLTKSPRRLYWC